MSKKKLSCKEGFLTEVVAIIGLACLVLVVLSSCFSVGTVDRSVSFHDFSDNPALRERFVGSWRTESQNLRRGYAITVFHADGSMSETNFDNNQRVVSTWGGMYKVSSTQLIMRVSNNREAIWNYNFVDNDTFSVGSGSNNLLYRREN
jgi:hypothetical protein